MATVLDELIVKLGSETDLSGFRRLETRVERTRARLDNFASGALKVGTALTAAAVGTLTGFAAQQAKFSEVSAKTGIDVQQLRDDYAQAARDISEDTGIATTSILDGFQKAISAGVTGADAIRLVGKAARSEAAGIGLLTDQISSATTIMEVFGIDGADALDIIARAAQVGEGETADFAQSLKGIAATAKPLKVPFEELASALAAASQTAKSVPVAETQLNSFLRSIQSPSKESQKALKEFTGGLVTFQTIQRSIQTDGLDAVIGTLQTIADSDPEKIARLFPREEAQQFFNVADPVKIRALFEEIEAGSGTISRAFDEGSEDVRRMATQTREVMRNLAADIGETLAPSFSVVNGLVREFAEWFSGLGEGPKQAIGHLLVIGPLLLGAAVFARGLSLALGGFGPAGQVIRDTAGKIRGALSATLSFLTTNAPIAFQSLQGAAQSAFRVIQIGKRRLDATLAFAGWKGVFLSSLSAVRSVFATAFTGIVAAFGTSVAGIKALAVVMWAAISGPALPIVLGIVALAALLIAAWKPISTFFSGLWGGLTEGTGRVSEAFGRLLDALGPVGEGIRAGFQAVGDAWSWLVNLFGDQSDVGRGWGEGIIDGVVSVIDSFTSLINWFRNFSLADLIADAVSGAGDILSNAVSGALQLVRDLLPSSDARTGPLSDLTRSGRSIMETLSDGVRRSAPLRVALTAGALTLPPVDQIVSPVVEDLVGNLPEVSQTVSPVVEDLNRSLSPIEQTVSPVVSGLGRLATDLSPVAQVVSPVVEDLNRTLAPIEQTVSPMVQELTSTLEPIEQTVSPVTDGLPNLPGGLADIDNLERFFPVGPVPLPPVPAAATSRETTVTIRIEEGAIQIRSDGNSREIAEAVHRGLAEAVRDAVEQADSQVIV